MLLKAEGGWKSLRMVERYTQLMPSVLAPAIATVWGDHHAALGRLAGATGPATTLESSQLPDRSIDAITHILH